jgi:hypothetical protein
MYRLTRAIADAKAETINRLNGIDTQAPACPFSRIGQVYTQRRNGHLTLNRVTSGGGSMTLVTGTTREVCTYLDGMIEQARIVADRQQRAAERRRARRESARLAVEAGA